MEYHIAKGHQREKRFNSRCLTRGESVKQQTLMGYNLFKLSLIARQRPEA